MRSVSEPAPLQLQDATVIGRIACGRRGRRCFGRSISVRAGGASARRLLSVSAHVSVSDPWEATERLEIRM